jgi:hypothetical protein
MNRGIQACVGIVSMALLACTAKAANIAYAQLGNGTFGTLDLGTGAFSSIGPSGDLNGLGVFGGAIYGGADLGNTLFQINQSTGALTSVGTASINFEDLGSTLTGLFAVDTSLNLYSVNAGTGATTLIGSTGLTIGATVGMSDNSSTLYLTNGPNLYSLNTSNGAATLVGSLGSGIGIGALLFQGGTVYGGQNHPSLELDTIDTGTGAATSLTGVNFSGTVFGGLAPIPVSTTPEPASWLLVITGAATLGAAHFRRLLTRNRSLGTRRMTSVCVETATIPNGKMRSSVIR